MTPLSFKTKISFIFLLFALVSIGSWALFTKTIDSGPALAVSDVVMSETATDQPLPAETASAAADYGKLPINFEPNVGQVDADASFVARGRGYAMMIASDGATLQLRAENGKRSVNTAVKMSLEGGRSGIAGHGVDLSGSKSNYLIGNDPEKWQTNVDNYKKVRFDAVYDGIDVVYYGNGRELEYDFVVAPGVDPSAISLKIEGASRAIDEKSGDLVLTTSVGTLRQLKPVSFQETENGRREVASAYKLEKAADGSERVKIALGDYDRGRELVIDPILAYGSYLGGGEFDDGRAITVDAQGSAYVVGTSASLNFPTTTGALKTTNPPSQNNVQWYDAYVTKVNATGTATIFSTYFGGRNGSETGGGVALDDQGNILLSGTTMSGDLPLVNPYQSTPRAADEAFAAKLNPTGSALIFSTFLGGEGSDAGGKIVVEPGTGNAIFTGGTSSGSFPTTPGAYKEQICNATPGSCNGVFFNGGYLVKFAPNGSVIYSTLFSAGVQDVTLDSVNNVTFAGGTGATFITTPGAFQTTSSGGSDGYIAKLNAAGNSLVYATFLGGGTQSDIVRSIVLDSSDNIYVVGKTQNAAFPTTAGAYDQTFNGGEDGFITKLNPAGSALVFSTFFGGQGKDEPFGIGIDAGGDVFIAGETLSNATFPVKNSLLGTGGSIFVSRIDATGSTLVYSTILGIGGAYDLAVDASSNAYITGHTTKVLVTPNSFQPIFNRDLNNISSKDGYVLKIAPTDEGQQMFNISGTVVDDNVGFNNNYRPIVVTITGAVTRSYNLPYNGGQYFFGALPAGGNYTVTAKKLGYETDPESVEFPNLGANQFADFHILRNREPEGVITSPAHGTIYNFPASINIQATASDPDGDAIVKVDFVAYNSTTGSTPLGTDTEAPYEFTWNNVPIGTHALYAYPTDSRGLRGESMEVVHIHVVDGGQLGVSFIDPIEGQSFSEGSYVPIRMAVSSSVTLVDVKDQNNERVAWLNGPPWSSTWRVMNVGSYTLTATAFNAQGQSIESAPVHITVVPINHLISGKVRDDITMEPIAGVSVSLTSPTNPAITAQATTDAEGNYSFTGLGTTPNDGVVITPTLAGHSFEPETRSITYLGYIEWPNQNFFATQDNTINVAMTSPTAGQVFTAPAAIELAADATTGAGTITKVEFYRSQATPVLLGTDQTAPFAVTLTDVGQGFPSYFARAFDSTGAVKDSSGVNVQVLPPVTTVRLQGDIENSAGGWMQGITVRLTGTVNGGPINQTTTSNSFGAYGFFNLPAGGDWVITPEAAGHTFTPVNASFTNVNSDIFDIDFTSSGFNQPPTVQINSPVDGASYTMPASIPINVSAADPDGSVVHLSVSAQSPTVSTTIGQANAGSITFNWQPNLPAPYTLFATARDNGGLRTTVSISITVNPPVPETIGGRIVNRSSVGIEGVLVELKDYPEETAVIGTATTDGDGNYNITGVPTFANYVLRASKEGYSFAPQQRLFFNLPGTQVADFTGTSQAQRADFDGDNVTDLSVWRPSTGTWWISRSTDKRSSAVQFGSEEYGDVVTPGNYDGDRKIDHAVYRAGMWYIMDSTTGAVHSKQFGTATDIPVPADYDGDGRTDIAIYRPSYGQWWLDRSSEGATVVNFGLNGDVPQTGDFDGDGKADLAVWRPSNGIWYVLRSTDGQMTGLQFGQNEDVPLTGDFDGDKKADNVIYRPSNGVWYIYQSRTETVRYEQFGIATDKPAAGDYDRDGKADVAVFRGGEGNWYIKLSTTGAASVIRFGMNGDVPIPGAFIR